MAASDNLKLLVRLDALDKASRPLRSIQKQSGSTREAIKSLQGQMKLLQSQSRDIAAYKAQQAALAPLTAEIEKQRETVKTLGAAYEAAKNPSAQLTKNFENAQQKLKRLDGELEAHSGELQQAKARLDAAGLSTDKLADHEEQLARRTQDANFQIGMQRDRLKQLSLQQRKVDDARSRYSRTNAMAGNIAGSGTGAIAAGLAIAAPLKVGLDNANELQSSVTTIAQRTNMGAAAAKRFETNMLAAGRAANQTRDETTATFDEFSAQGFDPAPALAMARAVGRAATAYRENGIEIAKAAGSFRNLNIEVSDTARGLDIMAVAGKAGNFEFGDMARAFPTLTAGAAAYGMTGTKAIADISAALQIARRGAGSSEEAATNLENVLQKIGSPETAKNFAKVGINLREEMEKGKKAGVSALETIIELTRRATKGDATRMGDFFQDAQVQNGLRPLLAATADYRRIRAEALAAHGVVDADFARRMEDAAQAAKAMGVETDRTSIILGKHLQPMVTQASNLVSGAAKAFNDWAENNPALAKTLTTIAVITAGLLLVFGGMALAVAAVLAPFALAQLAWSSASLFLLPLAGGLWAAVTATWAWTAALLANPITWIVLAIVAAIAVLAGIAYLIYKNWAPISAWFAGVWTAIQNGTHTALQWFRSLPAAFMEIGRNLISGMINGVTERLGALKSTITSAASSAANWFREKLGIHSPSRVFMAFGQHTMNGLALGIERARNRPLEALGTVGAGMAGALALGAGGSALAAPAGGPGAPSTSAGDTYNISVQAAPGQDAKAIAEAVWKIIQEKQAAQRRASFGDDFE